MTINLFWMAKWAILLGLLFGGAGSAQPVERVGLEELLARQERQERAIYWVGLASGMALLISLGLVVLRWRLGTVQARRFVLRDAKRQLVAQLAAGYNGGELELRDAEGEIPAVLGDGLRLLDGEGQVRAGLRLGEDGAPFLELYDERGEVRAGFSLSEDGAGSLAFYDETGQPRAGLGSGQTGAMRLSFLDAAGHVRW
jgi:hypothetical protein